MNRINELSDQILKDHDILDDITIDEFKDYICILIDAEFKQNDYKESSLLDGADDIMRALKKKSWYMAEGWIEQADNERDERMKQLMEEIP